MDDASFRSELRRYWDAIARGEPAAPGALDPDIVATIRRLHALRDVPPPDTAFAQRLEESLMDATALRLPLPDLLSRADLNGRAAPRPGPGIHPSALVPSRRRTSTSVVTALLVLIVLLGSVLAFGPLRPGPRDDSPAFLPAVSGTPATSPPVVTETLFDATLEGLPTGFGTVALLRWTLDPGPEELVFAPLEGPRFFVVESGALTAIEAGTEHQLGAGDTYIPAAPDQDVAFRASGPWEATLLRGLMATYLVPAATGADPAAHRYQYLLESSHHALPGGSGRLIVERLTLPPESALPPQEAGPFDWMEVAEGTLGLTLEGDGLPPDWATGEEQTGRFSMGLPLIPAGTRITLRNAGDDLLVLYRMTLTPSAAETAAATPIP